MIVEVVLNASAEQVWKAITEVDQMKLWYFENIPAFEAHVGFETTFEMISDERIYTATWKVLEVIDYSKIRYSWTYDEYKDGLEQRIGFFLKKEGKTLLTVINEGLETFPQDVPEFTRRSCIGGWEYFLLDRLKKYLESEE